MRMSLNGKMIRTKAEMSGRKKGEEYEQIVVSIDSRI